MTDEPTEQDPLTPILEAAAERMRRAAASPSYYPRLGAQPIMGFDVGSGDMTAVRIGDQSESFYLTFNPSPSSVVFHAQSGEVMRITPDGELIVHDATEAAKALKQAWDQLMGGLAE